MNYYPKIDTLFRRGEDFRVVASDFKRPEFAYVDQWRWMEKLDGANISIVSANMGTGKTFWRGRTDKSQFTKEVENHLNMLVEDWHEPLQKQLEKHKLDAIEVFGEIYGPKIQNGGIYTNDLSSKFYDIRVNNRVWLPHEAVKSYADYLDFLMPDTGMAKIKYLVELVRNGFITAEVNRGGNAEGVVAKTDIPLYNNNDSRLIWKLKTKDFPR